jgi:hypothetical protein
MSKSASFHFNLVVDGKSYDVHTNYSDMVRYDVIRSRHGYPPFAEAGFVAMGILAYSALVRLREIDANTSPDSFLDKLEELDVVEDEEAEAEFPG